MMAPPGRPKMVETPSSTSDWHMARAPFRRIICPQIKKSPPPLQRRGLRSRGTTLFVLSAAYRPPPRSGLLTYSMPCPLGEGQGEGFLPNGSEASSGTWLHRSFTIRRLSSRSHDSSVLLLVNALPVYSCWAEPYTFRSSPLKPVKHSTTRILTTHVGSLPRPKQLLDLTRNLLDGRGDETEYDDALREAVVDAVRQQVARGIDVVT